MPDLATENIFFQMAQGLHDLLTDFTFGQLFMWFGAINDLEPWWSVISNVLTDCNLILGKIMTSKDFLEVRWMILTNNQLKLYLISLLVNLSSEWRPVMIRYDFPEAYVTFTLKKQCSNLLQLDIFTISMTDNNDQIWLPRGLCDIYFKAMFEHTPTWHMYNFHDGQ